MNQDFYANIYKSDDGGEFWSLAGTVDENTYSPLFGNLIVDENRGAMWAALDQGLYRSNSDGTIWDKVSGFYGLTDAFIDILYNVYFCGDGFSGRGIYILPNGLEEWTFVELPENDPYVPKSLFIDEDGHYWVGSCLGLHYSPDNGENWFTYTKEDGLTSQIVNDVYVEGNGENRIIWIGTALGASKGVFKDVVINLSSVTISSDNPDPTIAKVGDTVTLNFTASDELLELPVVTIDGKEPDALYDLGNNDFRTIREMQSGDTEGVIQFTIDYKDFAGRPGIQVTEITSGSNVTFVAN